MKRFYLFVAVFLFAGGLFSVHAQDLIILRNGNVIAGHVIEITSTEVRYKHIDFLDGPDIPLSRANVLSVRYENGTVEIVTTRPLPEPKHETPKAEKSVSSDGAAVYTTAMDPGRLTFGISVEPMGVIPDAGGPSASIEFTKGKLNTQINFRFPTLNFDPIYDVALEAGLSLNWFHHTRTGGFYLGGLVEYTYIEASYGEQPNEVDYTIQTVGLAVNVGYKFVLSSGLYFRTGGNVGGRIKVDGDDNLYSPYITRSDLAIGINF